MDAALQNEQERLAKRNLTDRVTRAIEIAAKVHRYQIDKGGEPYILHVLTVMRYTDRINDWEDPLWREDLLCVAVLHDAYEDFEGTDVERDDFQFEIENTFGPRVHRALRALTHAPGEPYLDSYIERVAQNPLARRVKIADLTHNMDPRRLPAGEIGDREYKRWNKYRQAIVRLQKGVRT